MSSRLRKATRADNEALLALFGEVPMTGSLVLSTRRDPDLFALYDLQKGDADLWTVEDAAGTPIAMSATVARDGWLDGKPARVGYLGDLRTRFSARRNRSVLRFYGRVLEDAIATRGCAAFMTGVLASNAAAMNALVKRKKARGAQPAYHLLKRYSMVSVQLTGRRRVEAIPGLEVRTARDGDVPAIVALLDADHRSRPFGYRFDAGELEHRLARWPGFTLEKTYLAFARERLVGVTTAWDASSVKRYRVVAYRGAMLWTKRAFNAAAVVLGWPKLPEAGGEFRYLYLCNTSIAGDDPAVLRALLEKVYADHVGGGWHFFSLCEWEGDPLAGATRGFRTRRLEFCLYAVTRAGEEPPKMEGRPGFEMALA